MDVDRSEIAILGKLATALVFNCPGGGVPVKFSVDVNGWPLAKVQILEILPKI